MSIEDISTNLRTRGVYVSSKWLEKCIQFLITKNICNRYNNQVNDSPSEDNLLDRVWEMFLDWDLRETCSQQPVIPADLKTMHQMFLFTQQSYTFQIDEAIPICDSISSSKNNESEGNNSKILKSATALKVLLTDGVSQAVAYDFSGFLKSCQQGSKVRLRNVAVRRGALLLSPCDTELLGGEVKCLSANAISNENLSNVDDDLVSDQPSSSNLSAALIEPDGISNIVETSEVSRNTAMERSLSVVRANLFQSSTEEVSHEIENSPIPPHHEEQLFRLESLEQHHQYSNPICDIVDTHKHQGPAKEIRQSFRTFDGRQSSSISNNNCILFAEEANNDILLSDQPMVPEDLEITIDDHSASRHSSTINLESSSESVCAGLVHWSEVTQQPIGARFRMRGITDSVTSFKIQPRSKSHHGTSEEVEDTREFYSTILFSDGMESKSAELSSQLVSAFLGLSPADYQATTSVGSKRSQKRVKDEILGRFQNFQGIFWAERLESTESAVNQQEILILLDGVIDGPKRSVFPRPVEEGSTAKYATAIQLT